MIFKLETPELNHKAPVGGIPETAEDATSLFKNSPGKPDDEPGT